MKSSLRFTLNMRDTEFQSIYASVIVFFTAEGVSFISKYDKNEIKLKLYPVCLKTNDGTNFHFSILSLYPVRVSCRADSTYIPWISIVCYTIWFFFIGGGGGYNFPKEKKIVKNHMPHTLFGTTFKFFLCFWRL